MSNAPLRFRSGGATVHTVVDPRFGTGATPTQPPGWGGGTGATPSPEASNVIVISPSGDTTGATDLANIQAAINEAAIVADMTTNAPAQTDGTPVTIDLLGTYWLNGPLVMKNGVHLRGHGWFATQIHLAPGANTSLLTVPDKTYWCGVSHMLFDGHVESQTAGGPLVDATPGGAVTVRGDSCSVMTVDHVLAQFSYGDAFRFSGVELRADNCFAYRAGRNGFQLEASDMWVSRCASGDAKNIGFNVLGGSHHISDCKSWWSGYYQMDRTKLASKGGVAKDNLNYCNWNIQSPNNMIVNCDGQDARGASWVVRGNNNQLTIQSDCAEGPALTLIGARQNRIHLALGDGTSHGTSSPAVVHLWGNGETGNYIRAGWTTSMHNGTPYQAGALGGSIGQAKYNDIEIGTPRAMVTTPYAATITPDPVLGGPTVTLTGDLTVKAPPADRFIAGTSIDVELAQDATGGRAITWDAAYVGASPADLAPNRVNRWTFRCLNGKWVQTAFTAY